MTRRVLVTGAFGYVGLALLRGLAGYEVVALGHPPRSPDVRTRIPGNVERLEGDISQAPELIERHGPFFAVLHLAGGGGPAKLAADPVQAVRNNIRLTSSLAAAARQGGVARLVYASTIAVYGTSRDHGRPYLETDLAEPDDIYGAMKEAAEHIWVAHGGGTSLRLSNVYGAGVGVDMGIMGAAERFARAAAAGEELTIFGTGAQRIDYVHIDDVVAAFTRCLEVEAPPTLINIGGGSPIAIAELAALSVAAGSSIGSRPSLRHREAPAGKLWPDRSLSIQRAKATLGWEPSVAYERGVRELVEMMAEGHR